MLGALCNQTVNLKTDFKNSLLIKSILKLKSSPSIFRHNEGLKKYASLNNSHNNNYCDKSYMIRIFLQKHKDQSIYQSLHPTGDTS